MRRRANRRGDAVGRLPRHRAARRPTSAAAGRRPAATRATSAGWPRRSSSRSDLVDGRAPVRSGAPRASLRAEGEQLAPLAAETRWPPLAGGIDRGEAPVRQAGQEPAALASEQLLLLAAAQQRQPDDARAARRAPCARCSAVAAGTSASRSPGRHAAAGIVRLAERRPSPGLLTASRGAPMRPARRSPRSPVAWPAGGRRRPPGRPGCRAARRSARPPPGPRRPGASAR